MRVGVTGDHLFHEIEVDRGVGGAAIARYAMRVAIVTTPARERVVTAERRERAEDLEERVLIRSSRSRRRQDQDSAVNAELAP